MPTTISKLVDAAGRSVSGGLEIDSWAPSVQGAVGHLVGVRGADGSPYVLKVYGAGGGRTAATEIRALRLLGDVAEVPVPRVLCHEVAGHAPRPYVLMTRLPGVRWADRRVELDARQAPALHRAVGCLLRRLHVVTHDRFGDVLDDGARWPTLGEAVTARCDRLVDEHLRDGGSTRLAHRVRRQVDAHRAVFDSCPGPVLCHNDLIDSNLLVAAAGEPRLCGVVDLERASWGDPLADLAQTRLHVRYHDPAGAEILVEAYGVATESERRRVALHEVLHAFAERIWINVDRPAGWKRSIAALDAFVLDRT